MWMGIGLSIVLLILGTYLPGLTTILRTTNPGIIGWLMIFGMSLIPLLIGQSWISFSDPVIRKLKLIVKKSD
jgi:Ca2+-transporting ATPase